MSSSMLRSTWRSASSSSWSSAVLASQPIAGPSKLRFAVPRCSCGEVLQQQQANWGNKSRRRWMSSSRALYQTTSTASSPASTHAPPMHGMGIDKNVPPPATVEAPPAAPQQTPSKPPLSTAAPAKARPARREIKAQKAAITLTPTAVEQLSALLDSPTPKLIRIGVRNKGCAGMAYHLEYVEKPGKFDEVIEQDGVKVLIDSKALFSIVGSEMDWQEDKISSKFVFKNPNIKEQCGCGESFLT